MAKDKLPEIPLGIYVKDKISYSTGIVVWQKKHVDGRYTFGVQPRAEGAPRLPEWEAEEHQLVHFTEENSDRYDPDSSRF